MAFYLVHTRRIKPAQYKTLHKRVMIWVREGKLPPPVSTNPYMFDMDEVTEWLAERPDVRTRYTSNQYRDVDKRKQRSVRYKEGEPLLTPRSQHMKEQS